MNLMNGRAAVFDLSSGESSEMDLTEEQVHRVDMVALSRELASQIGGGSLVLGSGVLTGSLVPAACAGFLSAGGKTAPLMGFAGVELKLTGFDLIFVKGRAAQPGYLWARDGQVEFVPSPGLSAADSWSRTDAIRDAQGDRRIQVLACGPWGDRCDPCSQLIVNYWGGEDKLGLAAEFGARGLLAVAFRGMGELELGDADGHFESALELRGRHISSLGVSSGLASYAPQVAGEDLVRLVHRHIACFGCPFPCRSFAKVEEPATEMALVSKEPGYLHYDVPALAAARAAGHDARGATRALMKCARAGAEPVSVLSSGALDKVLSAGPDSGVRPAIGPLSGSFESSFSDASSYATCLGLGLCPRYWARAGLDLQAVSACAEPALGHGLDFG